MRPPLLATASHPRHWEKAAIRASSGRLSGVPTVRRIARHPAEMGRMWRNAVRSGGRRKGTVNWSTRPGSHCSPSLLVCRPEDWKRILRAWGSRRSHNAWADRCCSYSKPCKVKSLWSGELDGGGHAQAVGQREHEWM
jgi:hypothetical protein